MDHLDAEQLERYLVGEGPASEARAIREHLSVCSTCRYALEARRHEADLLDEIRGAVGPHDAPGGAPAIEGYDDLVEMHRGGQGVVYRATRAGAASGPVAIKVLLGGRFASARDRFRFEREIEVASSLEHPNIVTVIDSGLTADGHLFCVMPFVDGLHLDEWVRRHPGDIASRVALFARIVEPVAYAHRHGVVHRDLKPANLLVDEKGEPHVLDFGLAMSANERRLEAERLTITGQFLGTLAYAAPEQFRAAGPPAGPASDVHALGVCLYEMLTGVNPYADASPTDGHERREAPDPKALDRSLPEDLRTIVRTALAPDPSRRYASAEWLARDLARYREGRPIEAERESPWRVLRTIVARYRVPIAISAAFVVVVGIGVALLVREKIRTGDEERRAELIQSVFNDILQATSPQRMGAEARVTDVLRESARRIESTLDRAPDAQAAVQFAIGETFARSMQYERAVEHLELALERYREIEGAALETARCLARLGIMHASRGRGEAIECLEESLAIRRRVLGQRDPLVAATTCDLGVAYESLADGADPVRAASLYETAVDALERTALADSRLLARARFYLARSRARDGREAEALALFREAVAGFDLAGEARNDESDLTAIECLDEYAGFLRTSGRREEADATLARAVELTRRWFGLAAASGVLRRFVQAHLAEGDHASSEILDRHALACALDDWGTRRPHDAESLDELARALEGAANIPELETRRRAFRRLREFEGSGSYELAAWMKTTASVLSGLGRRDDAEALLREALTIHCRLYGDHCPIRLESQIDLAEARRAAGDCDEAVALARAVRESLGDAPPEANELVQRVRRVFDACVEESRVEPASGPASAPASASGGPE